MTEDKFGFKSRKCPPQNDEMDKFEADLMDIVKNIKFRNATDNFLRSLKDINKIVISTKAFLPADKTTNFYKLDKPQYNKLLKDSITSTYRKADKTTKISIDREARSIAADLKIDDRTECIAPQQAFITLKDHKENFANNPTCRLMNPAKSELGIVSKKNTRHQHQHQTHNCIKPMEKHIYRDDGLALFKRTSGPQAERK